jgi:hypothetical protein
MKMTRATMNPIAPMAIPPTRNPTNRPIGISPIRTVLPGGPSTDTV